VKKTIEVTDIICGCINLSELNSTYSHLEDVRICPGGYDGSEIEVRYEREETDEEYEKRKKQEAKELVKRKAQILSKREKDLKQLARLKKLYEK
jgi:hypothetical protein